jgi:addiction module RelB/DinJ family antitoxin
MRDKLMLSKIKKYAEEAIQFKDEMTLKEFEQDEKTVAACVFNLRQIGEVAGKLTADTRDRYPELPWHSLRGLRYRILHDYEGVSLNIIWETIEDSLSDLVRSINKIEKRGYKVMVRTVSVHVRVKPEIKERAEQVFDYLGLTVSEAINIFLHKAIMVEGIPFDVRPLEPNAETLEAIHEVERMIQDPSIGKGYTNVEEMMKELLAE